MAKDKTSDRWNKANTFAILSLGILLLGLGVPALLAAVLYGQTTSSPVASALGLVDVKLIPVKTTPASAMPSARAGASMAFDPQTGQVILFGGIAQTASGADSADVFGDTWEGDGSNWTELFPAHSPPPRAFASMTISPIAPGKDCGETVASFIDNKDCELILFGGLSASGTTLNDTWAWTGDNWVELHPRTSPPARAGAAASLGLVGNEGRAILFGGITNSHSGGTNTKMFNDTWSFDGNNWVQLFPKASPDPRAEAAMSMFGSSAGGGRTYDVLFGGVNGNISHFHVLGDTWVWNGTDWTKQAVAHSPSPRLGAALSLSPIPLPGSEGTTGVPDQFLNKFNVLLFGGTSAINHASLDVFNDTWLWNGTDWIRQEPPSSPKGVAFAQMALSPLPIGAQLGDKTGDHERNTGFQVLLFSGQTKTTLTNLQFTWDGEKWFPAGLSADWDIFIRYALAAYANWAHLNLNLVGIDDNDSGPISTEKERVTLFGGGNNQGIVESIGPGIDDPHGRDQTAEFMLFFRYHNGTYSPAGANFVLNTNCLRIPSTGAAAHGSPPMWVWANCQLVTIAVNPFDPTGPKVLNVSVTHEKVQVPLSATEAP